MIPGRELKQSASSSVIAKRAEHAAVIAAGSTVAEKLAGVLYCQISDYLKGGYFSHEQVEVLESMKTIYRRCFEDQKLAPPAQWELREDNRPKFYMRAHSGDWTQYIDDQVFASDGFGFLHNKIVWYVRLAASYLKKRSDAGHGFAGDHIEMFFVENINWALSSLVSFSAEPGAIRRLQARIKYLQKIRAIKNMFPEERGSWCIRKLTSFVTFNALKYYDIPSFTHIDTTMEMEEALHDIILYMENVIKLASARDIVGIIKNRFELSFSSAFDYLFALRDAVFDRPMSLKQWLEDDEKAEERINVVFPGLLGSHTGSMLRDLVRICDRTIFTAYENGFSACKSRPVYGYFDSASGYRYLTELPLASGVPGWLTQDPSVVTEFLYKYYDVCAVLRKTAQCYKLVTCAYSLAGNRGNVWAFGSEGGRTRFHRLILILTDSLTELQEVTDKLRLYSKRFFDAKREQLVSSHDVKNVIFNTSERTYESYIKHKQRVLDQLQQLATKIDEFNVSKARAIEAETREFDTKLRQYLSRFGRKSLQANLREMPLPDGEVIGQPMFDFDLIQEQVPVAERLQLGLDFPVVNIGGFLTLNRSEFSEFTLANHYQHEWRGDHYWKIGDSYSIWADGFVHRCKPLIKYYQNSLDTLRRSLLALRDVSDAQEREQFVQAIWFEPVRDVISSINQFFMLLEQQRPAWRFGLFLWVIPYVKTAGWPFHQRERRFAESFSDYLFGLREQVRNTTTRVIYETPLAEVEQEGEEKSLQHHAARSPQSYVYLQAPLENDRQAEERQLSKLLFCKVVGRLVKVARGVKSDLISLSAEMLGYIAEFRAQPGQLKLLTDLLPNIQDERVKAYIQVLFQLSSRHHAQGKSQAIIQAYLKNVAINGEAKTIVRVGETDVEHLTMGSEASPVVEFRG